MQNMWLKRILMSQQQEKQPVADTKFDFRVARKMGTTLLDDPFLLDHTQDWDLKVTSPDEKFPSQLQRIDRL